MRSTRRDSDASSCVQNCTARVTELVSSGGTWLAFPACFGYWTVRGRASSMPSSRALLSGLAHGCELANYRERERVMRRLVRMTAGGMIVAVALSGCAAFEGNRAACLATSALIGSIPLAVGGGVGTHNIETGSTPSGQVAAGAAAGAVAGGLLGLLVGHHLCPQEEVMAEPPPPPPPPPIQRRGG